MRAWICCALLCSSAHAEYRLDLDHLAVGDSANDAIAASYGVLVRGLGDGGPFDVIADEGCLGDLSTPNVFSLQVAPACPEINDLFGFYEVEFEIEQAFVSVRTIHAVPGTVSYLMAYDGPNSADFVDQVLGDYHKVGTPQILRIDRDRDESQIRRVRFGVYNLDNRKAAFDDLIFEQIPVTTQQRSWSAVKALW